MSLASTSIGVGNWGQLIGMIQYTNFFKADTNYKSNFLTGVRLIAGNSNLQVSLEWGYNNSKSIDGKKDYVYSRATLGAEVKITDGIWFEVATGLNNTLKGTQKSTPIALGAFKYALQKKSRFSIP